MYVPFPDGLGLLVGLVICALCRGRWSVSFDGPATAPAVRCLTGCLGGA